MPVDLNVDHGVKNLGSTLEFALSTKTIVHCCQHTIENNVSLNEKLDKVHRSLVNRIDTYVISYQLK